MVKKNTYDSKKNIYELKLKKIKNTSYSNSGRQYYTDDKKRIFMSQEENPLYVKKEFVRKDNNVFYNANNKIGEPEFALSKNKYKITVNK